MSSIRVVAKTFAKHIQEKNLNPQDYVFVFPNQRAGLFFRKYLAQEFEKPIIAPKITTISELFSDFSHLKKETDIALLFRLYDIYTDVIRGQNGVPEPLSDFIHWGKMMLSDFSEVDNHLVANVDKLFANIVDLQEINKRFADYLDSAQIDAIRSFWQSFCGSKPEAMHEKFLENWNLLLPLYNRLRESLLGENLAYSGMLQRDVIENFDQISDEKFTKKYVFAGFNALSQSEEQLMLKLQEKGIADFYFDYDLDIITDPDNRASLFIEDNKKFCSKLNVEAENYQQPHVQWINVPGTIAQTYEVHKILDQLFPKTTTEEDSYANTAVILPDEALLLPLLNTIPEQIKKINVTMGYPLRATNLYAPIMYPERYFENLEQSNLDAILQALQDKLKEMQTQEESEAYFQIQSQLNVLIELLKNQTYKDFLKAEKDPIQFFFDILQM
ncbi:MAG: hypothetical protein II502_04120, partial [Paludibacteraceae bacterium]|nr:hypothetical protein [Paludibacteraceae bacterium]